MSKDKIIKISDLKPDTRNANKGTQRGRGMIERSIQQYGMGRSILLDKDNNVIAGNKTLETAVGVGIDKVRIIETDGTEIIAVKRTNIDLNSKEGRELAIADNRAAEVSLEWDFEIIEELESEGVEIGLFWDEDELPQKPIEVEEDNYELPDEIHTDIVRGDLIEIGQHRLLCGDSTNSDDVAKLMAGDVADLVFTDPMYDDSAQPIISILNLIETKHFLIMATFRQCIDFVNNSEMKFRFDLVLNQKIPSSAMSKLVPYYLHKNIIYLSKCKEGIFSCDNAIGEFSDVGYYPSVIESPKQMGQGHGLAKNSDGVKKILSGFKFKSVLDLFIGSGSTMVAAHQMGRKCFGIEIEPKYCQIIIERMRKIDGSLIVKVNDKVFA